MSYQDQMKIIKWKSKSNEDQGRIRSRSNQIQDQMKDARS